MVERKQSTRMPHWNIKLHTLWKAMQKAKLMVKRSGIEVDGRAFRGGTEEVPGGEQTGEEELRKEDGGEVTKRGERRGGGRDKSGFQKEKQMKRANGNGQPV